MSRWRSYWSWHKSALPSRWWAAVMVVGLGLIYLWPTGASGENKVMLIIGVSVAALLEGFARAGRNNPREPAYEHWLMQSPWEPGDRLPFGPVALHLLDVAIIVAFSALLWPAPLRVLVIPAAAYLSTYLLRLIWRDGGTGQWMGVVQVLAPPVWILLWPRPMLVLLFLLLLYPLVLWLMRMKHREEKVKALQLGDGPRQESLQAARALLNSSLLPTEPDEGWGESWSVRITALLGVGLWTFALLRIAATISTAPDWDGAWPLAVVVWFGIVGLVGLARRSRYPGNRPIALWGRVMHDQWIIPAYDVAWSAALLVIIVGWGVAGGLWLIDVPLHWALTLATVAATAVILFVGPTREQWLHTAPVHVGMEVMKPTEDMFDVEDE